MVKVFKFIEWLFFILFCIASIMLTQQVWEQYKSYDSNFKKSVGLPSESPTIVFCFWPIQANPFQYGKDFNISYMVDSDLQNLQILNEGKNIIETKGDFVNGTTTIVYYEVLDTLETGRCHRISSDMISSHIWAAIIISLDSSILKENLPDVNYIISSGNNSYGRIISDRTDGAVLSDFATFEKEIWMEVQSEKFVYLDPSISPISKCKQGVYFYECFQNIVLQEIGNNCPSKCFPASNQKYDITTCKTQEEIKCARNVIIKTKLDKSFKQQCPRSCVTIEYRKTYQWVGNFVENFFNISSQDHAFWFWYKTDDDEHIYIEYLIYDSNSMIGAVGGTLGLFIGFSFNNVITFVINKIQKCFLHRPNSSEFCHNRIQI